jgi:hypothetical protein
MQSSTALQWHALVLCLANFESRNVVRGNVLKEGNAWGPRTLISCMTDVEQCRGGPDGQVFLDNAEYFTGISAPN